MDTEPGTLSPVRPAADLFDLTGRVAVVTGASSGLGARFAEVLHTAGATVVVAARRAERLDALADRLGDRVVAVPTDLSDEVALIALAERAAEVGGGAVDVLVNNAGTMSLGPAESEPIGTFRHVLEVNLTGLFRLTQLVAGPMLERRRGSIVNVASMLGLVGSTPVKQASYCASKGAVVNLTRELACQWARKGLRVNALAPGWFPSEMTADMLGDASSERFVADQCPMARWGEAHELDGALLLLASDASSYLTGQVLTVDGGWTAR